jgi:hypothetical protein
LDPKFRTDLYELDLATHAIRRLTDLHQVVPEFYFNPSGTTLLWTTGELTHTYVGRFSPTPAARRRPVRRDPAWVGAPRHGNHTPPEPEAPASISLNLATIPQQELDAISLMESQLAELAHLLAGLPLGASCCQAPA